MQTFTVAFQTLSDETPVFSPNPSPTTPPCPQGFSPSGLFPVLAHAVPISFLPQDLCTGRCFCFPQIFTGLPLLIIQVLSIIQADSMSLERPSLNTTQL